MEEVIYPMVSYSKEYTYADYLKFDFDYMVEIIRGQTFKMTPAASMHHQRISSNLHEHLYNFINKGKCQIYAAPTDIVLPVASRKCLKSTTVVQLDLCIMCDTSIIEKQAVFGPPTLVVEILSPHTRKRDLQLKYDIYVEASVQEY